MKKHFHSLLTPILLTIAAAAMIFSPLPLARWHQLSETSQGGRGFMMLSFLAGFTLLVPFLAAPVGAVLLLFPGKRRTGGSLLVCSIVFVITAISVARLSKPIHHRAFQALAVRSEPLVGAIHQYAKAKGHPPAALSDLVPEYLPAVPGTGLPAYPNYEYSTASEEWQGNPWALYINTPSGVPNWDMFIYFPWQNYPERGYAGRLEKIRDWAYVHE